MSSHGTSRWLAPVSGRNCSGCRPLPGRRQSRSPLAELHGARMESPDLGYFSRDHRRCPGYRRPGGRCRPVSSAETAGGRRVELVLVWEVGTGPRRGRAVCGLLVGPPRGHVMWDQCRARRARTRNASGGSSQGQGEFSVGR